VIQNLFYMLLICRVLLTLSWRNTTAFFSVKSMQSRASPSG